MKWFGLLLTLLAAPLPAMALPAMALDVREIGFEQQLNASVAPELSFLDEHGVPSPLARYLNGSPAPVILLLAYYRCGKLCTLALDTLAESLQSAGLKAGEGYRVVVVSIDPGESPPLAEAKKAQLVTRFPRAGIENGWHFLTGDPASIRQLAQSVGFRYAYDAGSGQYVHPAGIVLLTTTGRIARYFFGLRFEPLDLRLGLAETSADRIGSPLQQLQLLCYDYDSATGRYSLQIMKVLRFSGLLTLVLLAVFWRLLWLREKRRAVGAPGNSAAPGGRIPP